MSIVSDLLASYARRSVFWHQDEYGWKFAQIEFGGGEKNACSEAYCPSEISVEFH
jgi:hypothetical protein